MLRSLRPGLAAFCLAIIAGCADDPTGGSSVAPRGTLELPAGTYAALLEVSSPEAIDSVLVGHGDVATFRSPAGSSPYRVFVVSDVELRERLPISIVFAGEAGAVTVRLVETAAASGAVTARDLELVPR